MINFAYARTAQPEEAVRAAAAGQVAYVAGGTELLNWMRLGIARPQRVLDLGRVEALRGIRREGDALVIGALATLAEIEASREVREAAPALAEACLRAASAQIRNRASLGGNLLQKTRCAYFRAEGAQGDAAEGMAPAWPCNKRAPGSGCAALEGHHERLAIFGWTRECVATQPSDPAVALACLDAAVEVMGVRGRRAIAAREFHLTQEEANGALRENRLEPGELITAFRLPLAGARRSAYVKVRERESYEYAIVSAAAALELDGGRIRAARIALGSVAQRPWRLAGAEKALVGRPLERAELHAAVAGAMGEARPLARNAYKVEIAVNAAVRALENAGRLS
jgi:xanthine dehydrogenase YagS FAD-binding subunit